jgi:hypothetical protein
MSGRASIFAPREEIDVGGFQPKTEPERRPDPAEIDEVRSARFRSREPVSSQPSIEQSQAASKPTEGQRSTKRLPLVYRTGRNTTFSVKTTPETVDAFYEIARAQGWKAGETFELAIAALKEKLG